MKIFATVAAAFVASQIGLGAVACAQAGPAAAVSRLQFDAASVKPTDPGLRGMLSNGVNLSAGGRLVLHAMTLKGLVAIAYNVS